MYSVGKILVVGGERSVMEKRMPLLNWWFAVSIFFFELECSCSFASFFVLVKDH